MAEFDRVYEYVRLDVEEYAKIRDSFKAFEEHHQKQSEAQKQFELLNQTPECKILK